jgi:hypothetical protein
VDWKSFITVETQLYETFPYNKSVIQNLMLQSLAHFFLQPFSAKECPKMGYKPSISGQTHLQILQNFHPAMMIPIG